jgi:hypothetical protein
MTRSVSSSGFHGATGSLPLVDLLQVWGLNRTSGLVTITSEGTTGRLYLVEGELVHAEAGAAIGEAAVRTILGWPEGTFELAPNTTTLERTIQKKLSHLLLDAHRELDEARRARAEPPPPPPPAAAPRERARSGAVDQIRAIPEVAQVVSFGTDGRPARDAGPAAEALAARGLYLSVMHAAAVAGAFGLGELRLATLDSSKGSLVVVHGSGSYLALAVAPGAALDPLVARLRTILAPSTAR